MTAGYLNDYPSTITIGSPVTRNNPSLTISSSIQTALPVASASDKNSSTNNDLSNPATKTIDSSKDTSKLNVANSASNHVTKKVHKAAKTGRNHPGAKYLSSQYHPGNISKNDCGFKFQNFNMNSCFYKAKRIQEIITILIFIPLFLYNLYNIIIYFDASKWFVVLAAAGKLTLLNLNKLFFNTEFLSMNIFSKKKLVIGILTADFFSGIVHWASDSYGSVEMFFIGKVYFKKYIQQKC